MYILPAVLREERVRSRTKSSVAVVLLAGAMSLGAGAPSPQSQLAFGVDMARRGLWQEALFRFQQAQRGAGSGAHVLNNLAVAYEALGRFDQALATYREALAVAPNDGDLKRNYSRFLEFYQGYQSGPAEDADPPAATSEPAAEENP